LESNITGTFYGFPDDFSWDYGIISVSTYDGVYFISAWGLTHHATQAASLLLRYIGEKFTEVLDGHSVIFKWEDTNRNGVADKDDVITLIEKWS
jgi:hypothetical protein